MSDKEVNASISYREDLTHELSILRIAPIGWELPPFEPGQYAEIAFPDANGSSEVKAKLVRRPYSIASAKSEKDYLEFFIVRVEGGEFTPKLFAQAEGGKLWLNPKVKGKFTLEPVPTGKDLVMVSTGTGIAPFMSMLREYRGANRWRRLAMIHCVRYASDLGYRAELEALAANDPSFRYVPTVTREPSESEWRGLRGRVQEIFAPERFEALCGFQLDPEQTQVLMCGNPQMIDSMVELLADRGFREHSKKEPGNIHLERYW